MAPLAMPQHVPDAAGEPSRPAGIVLDASRWPLLLLRFGRDGSEADVLALYDSWEKEMVRRGRHAVISDFTAINPFRVSPKARKLVAEQVEQRRGLFERFLVAEARVVPHPVTRGFVTAFDWIVGSTFKRPVRNVADLAVAERWVVEELAKQGLGLPRG
jgi:hypothetical protein